MASPKNSNNSKGMTVQERAKTLVEGIPWEEIFREPELKDAFLAELLLAVAKLHTLDERRRLQAKGIERAKAGGVRFGAKRKPLPEHFDEAYAAWRQGLSYAKASKLCGVTKEVFYRAVQHRMQEEAERNQVAKPEGYRIRREPAAVGAE